MTEEEHLKNLRRVLVRVAGELNNRKLDWLLGSSGALYIQEIKVVPHDLDILVPEMALPELEKAFSEYITCPLQKEEGGKFKMEIEGIQVEMIGRDTVGEEKVMVDFEGQKIPVNPLEKELGFYENRPGKEDKVALIKQKLCL